MLETILQGLAQPITSVVILIGGAVIRAIEKAIMRKKWAKERAEILSSNNGRA